MIRYNIFHDLYIKHRLQMCHYRDAYHMIYAYVLACEPFENGDDSSYLDAQIALKHALSLWERQVAQLSRPLKRPIITRIQNDH